MVDVGFMRCVMLVPITSDPQILLKPRGPSSPYLRRELIAAVTTIPRRPHVPDDKPWRPLLAKILVAPATNVPSLEADFEARDQLTVQHLFEGSSEKTQSLLISGARVVVLRSRNKSLIPSVFPYWCLLPTRGAANSK